MLKKLKTNKEMEKKIEEIAKKFEFVLNLCDKFPNDMDLKHVVKTLKNDVTEILKEQTAIPAPSLPTDGEIKEDWDNVSKWMRANGFVDTDLIYNWFVKRLRTNFSSENDGLGVHGLNFAIWYSGMEKTKVESAYKRYLNETNPPKQEQQTTK